MVFVVPTGDFQHWYNTLPERQIAVCEALFLKVN